MSHPFRRRSDAVAALPLVQKVFAANRVIAYPTETVYGLAGALTEAGLEAVNAIKGRSEHKPFLLLINSPAMLDQWGFEVSTTAERLMRTFWPGPLTLILPNRDLRIPRGLRGKASGVAVRWTPHPGVADLIGGLGHPLVSTSANPAGLPPATSAEQVDKYFAAAVHDRELEVFDGGYLVTTLPSTLVDCTGPGRIIREGEITQDQLHEYL